MPQPVTVRAPGKVNLMLGVGPRRRDGYHELTTVFQALTLYDDVTLTPAEHTTVSIRGEGAADVPLDETNLAVQAVRAHATQTGEGGPVHIDIHKGIPVAGGMAGGSADAAAALLAADALWGTALDRVALSKLAAGLGSDVAFALHGQTALGTGRGERLAEVLGRGRFHWVLALARGGLSTPAVYTECDRLRETSVPVPQLSAEPVLSALRAGDPVALGRALANDLQPAATRLRPELQVTLDAGLELGALGGVVSGSGPTVALLARSDAHAVALAARLSAEGVCRTVRRAAGPAPGARVVQPGR